MKRLPIILSTLNRIHFNSTIYLTDYIPPYDKFTVRYWCGD